MTVVATIVLSEEDFVLGEEFADTTARIELLELVPTKGVCVPYFWLTGDHDPSVFEADVRETSAIDALTRLDSDDEQTLYRVDWSGSVDGFFGALADNDVLVDEGIRTTEEWTFQIRAPDKDALSGFRDDCLVRGSRSTFAASTTTPRRTTLHTASRKNRPRRSNWRSRRATSRSLAKRRSPISRR